MVKTERSNRRPSPAWLVVIFCVLLACATLEACGGGAVVVAPGKPGNPEAGEPGETNLGSPLPSAIRIPDIASLEGYAFVVDTKAPSGIFRVDLAGGEAPYPLERYSFGAYERFQQGAIPDELLIIDEDYAFLTTSGGLRSETDPDQPVGEAIHLFDPTPLDPDRPLIVSVPVFRVTLDPPEPNSRGKPVSDLVPSYTSGIAASSGKLYVCTSNFSKTGRTPVCPPGTVLIYRWDPQSNPSSMTPSDPSHLVTTGYNPTEVTALGERFVLVTNTGVISIEDAWAVPKTEGSVDVIDTALDCIVATYPLGLGAPSYKPIAIAPDRTRALLSSVAYNYVYELDLTVLDDIPGACPDPDFVPELADAVLAGYEDPIVVGSSQVEANDFIVQVGLNWNGTRAYATGYNSGTLSILEVETREGVASPKRAATVKVLTPQAPTQEEHGPGPLAVRPGRPGIDYSGPDLFVLTGLYTGKVLSIQTY
jgi:hypothetical protein